MLAWQGSQIAHHEDLQLGDPELALQRTHFAGLDGVSEIDLGQVMQPIEVVGWIVDSSAQAVAEEIREWLDAVQSNDALVESGFLSRTFSDCTLESVRPGPILPFLGEGSALSIAKGSYFCECHWRWMSLRVSWS